MNLLILQYVLSVNHYCNSNNASVYNFSIFSVKKVNHVCTLERSKVNIFKNKREKQKQLGNFVIIRCNSNVMV